MKLSITRALLCSVAFLPSTAFAQDSFSLSPIFVFGGLLPTTLESTGSTIEVVNADELQEGGPGVTDALAKLPGVSVSANGGLGTSSTVRVRGLGDAYIGVRINGIDVSDVSSSKNGFNFGTLTSGTLDRVTLIKGTQSAIYGSDAIAGVIDVQTWRPTKDGASGSTALEYGSFNTRTATSSVGFRDDRFELAFSLSRVATDGFSSRSSDTEDDGFDQSAANLFAAYQLTDALRVGVTGLWSEGTSEFDNAFTILEDSIDETRSGLRAFAEFSQGAWVHEFSVSGYRSVRFDALSSFTNEFIGERLKAEYVGRVDLSPATKLAFGVDLTEEKASLDGTSYEVSNTAAFGEIQFSPRDDLELSATLRYDDYSDFEGQLSGRAALAWNATASTVVRASAGTGYRAPSLYERFARPTRNPLEPETSKSFDIGVEQQIDEMASLRATAFYTEIENLIQYNSSPDGYIQTSGTTISTGLELSGDYKVSDRLSLSGNYTYTIAETNGARLARVPRHQLLLAADFEVTDRLTAGLTATHVSDVLDGFGTLTPLDDYTVVDLTTRYDLTDTTSAYLTVRNLTDETYETARGYNTSERALYVGIQADF